MVSYMNAQIKIGLKFHTISHLLPPTLPDFLRGVPLAYDGILLAVETSRSQRTLAPVAPRDWIRTHAGLVSSHFFFLRRQVIQPVLDRPLVTLA